MYNYLSYLSNKRVKEFETLFNNRLEENKIPSLSVKNIAEKTVNQLKKVYYFQDLLEKNYKRKLLKVLKKKERAVPVFVSKMTSEVTDPDAPNRYKKVRNNFYFFKLPKLRENTIPS